MVREVTEGGCTRSVEILECLNSQKQHLACQVRGLLKAENFTAIEIEELKRKLNNRVQQEGLDDQQMPRESRIEGRNENEMERIESDVRSNDIGIETESVEIRQEDNDIVSRLKEILQTDLNNVPSLKTIDSAKVKAETKKINEILKNVTFTNIDNMRDVIKAAAILVSERVGVKRKTAQKQKDPFWKRRIENDIGKLRKDLSHIEAWFKGSWKNGKQQEKLDLKKKYSLRAKGFKTVMEELKQRISAKKEKLKIFVTRTTQYRQNRLFRNNQKVLYDEFGGKRKGEQVAPDAEASTEFLSNLWDNPVQHNESAEWLKQVEQEMKRVKKDSDISISKEDVSSKIRTICVYIELYVSYPIW